MSNIVKYLPNFLKNIREYKEICSTEDIEINDLDSKIKEVIQEVSIETAKGYGLKRYEKILNIVNSTNDIDERRFNVKSKLINQLPFNIKWLDNKLKNLVGANNYVINLDSSNYTITIQISHIFPNIAVAMKNDLIQQLPANLIININLFRTETANVYLGGVVHIGKFIKLGGA